MSALAPAIFVFEKSPRWESELKRRLANGMLRVRPSRSAADVLALCREAPGSVVVIDLTTGPAEALQLLKGLLQSQVRSIVIAPSESDELEWPARELGALDFVSDRIGGDALAEICRQALAGSNA